jgi:hypothetical protein
MGPAAAGDAWRLKQGSSFSEEKEAKRLSSVCGGTASIPWIEAVVLSKSQKFFGSFFKKGLLA